MAEEDLEEEPEEKKAPKKTPDASPLKNIRGWMWKAVAVVVIFVLLGVSGVLTQWLNDFNIKLPHKEQMQSMTMNEGTLINRSFHLTDQRGQTVGSDQYATKSWAVFFGFTHCPDVCPVTLSRLSHLWSQLKHPERLQVFFVTVDPLRDTPEALADYVKAFDPRIVALTGPEVLIAQITKNFNVYARKVQEPGESDYTMDHTATVILLRPDGSFMGTIDMKEPDATALAKLQRLVGG